MTRVLGAGTALAVGMSMAAMGVMPLASAATASLTIDPPGSPSAGPVELTGRVGVTSGGTTSVLYVVDATNSTAFARGTDCSGNGGKGPEDDFNGDGNVGDILDCEIAGVLALNGSLSSTRGVQAGLVAFANQAAAADLDPAGPATFVPPAFTGGDPRPRIETVTRSVVQNQIGLYTSSTLGGSGAGSAFNSAVQVSLDTLAAAPAGPKWVMFLSDGQAAIDDGLLSRLAESDVRLRSFDIGSDATCAPYSSLYKMASATGEQCVVAPDPANLAAGITGSEPDAVNGVTVSIGGTAVAAELDAVGGWRARFTLGAGTYTATATATLASGGTVRTQRTFDVSPAPGGPPPGTVAPGPRSLEATAVKVKRPGPMRAPLPSRVTGRVGQLGGGFSMTPQLSGSRVVLEARADAGDPWTKVDKDKVDRRGKFVLKWKPRVRLDLLRVSLLPRRGFAGSATAVPQAPISACKVVKGGGKSWSVSCRTTAKPDRRVTLLRGGKVLDRARVKDGSFRLKGTGKVSATRIDVAMSKRRHVRLDL